MIELHEWSVLQLTDPKLLRELTLKRGFSGLTSMDFATRELPVTRHRVIMQALCNEYSARRIDKDAGDDVNPNHDSQIYLTAALFNPADRGTV